VPVVKEYDVCGLGNALVDILVELDEAEFARLGFERGTMRLVDASEQQALLTRLHGYEPRLVSGGSVANSVIACSQLGGRCGFIGCVGDDRYGLFYSSEFEELLIDIGNPVIVGEPTGTSLCIITPDAERTMRTCLAVSSHLAARHVDVERISKAHWLFVEGYVLANPDTGQSAVREAIKVAKANGTKVALTCSEPFIVEVFGDAFREALAETDLLFCNAKEAQAVTGTTDTAAAFARLRDLVPTAVVTDGPNGAFVWFAGSEVHVPAFPCEPKDLTGAGDMFAGAFLYGVTHGIAPALAARAGNYLAMKVITQIGARLHTGTRESWHQAMDEGQFHF
jgi:sugar/nucleoside kinase (ribokinase family)